MSNCHILLPGLIGEGDRSPSLPEALTLLCTRGRRSPPLPIQGMDAFLLSSFGLPANTGIGAITGLADQLDTRKGYWIRIDPVHLHLNRNQLILLDTEALRLEQDEANELAHTINKYFKDQNLHVFTPNPTRWYLHLDTEENLVFHPKDQVAGQDINAYLPSGEKGMYWKTLLNEIQMLLFEHPVNEAREARGELAVNSLWPWGQGSLPVTRIRPWERILSNNPLAAGLATLGNLDHMILPSSADLWLSNIRSGDLVILEDLLVTEKFGDEAAWNKEIKNIEDNWFAPLLASLKSNQLNCIDIHLMTPLHAHHIETRKSDLWKIWRRSLPG